MREERKETTPTANDFRVLNNIFFFFNLEKENENCTSEQEVQFEH